MYTTVLFYLKSSLWTSTEKDDGQLVIDLSAKNREETDIKKQSFKSLNSLKWGLVFQESRNSETVGETDKTKKEGERGKDWTKDLDKKNGTQSIMENINAEAKRKK